MKSILLVHSDPAACRSLSAALAERGHAIIPATDAESAVRAYGSFRPGAVLVAQEAKGPPAYRLFGRLRQIDPAARALSFSLLEGSDADGAPARFGVRSMRAEEVCRMVEQALLEKPPREAGSLAPRIVIADDDPAVVGLLKRFLEELGYCVGAASDGAQALALIKRLRPHLVLLDVDMPRINGVETLRLIRAVDEQVSVVMLTGDDAVETMERCLAYGAYDYILKPFDFEYLGLTVYCKILQMTA